jgi:DNA-binding protein H-NS
MPKRIKTTSSTTTEKDIKMSNEELATIEQMEQELSLLKAKIAAAREIKVSEALKTISNIVEENEITLQMISNEIFKMSVKDAIEEISSKSIKPLKGEKIKKEKKLVQAKYEDPATGKHWSGRGLKPNWIKLKEQEGTLDSYLVKKS